VTTELTSSSFACSLISRFVVKFVFSSKNHKKKEMQQLGTSSSTDKPKSTEYKNINKILSGLLLPFSSVISQHPVLACPSF